jgi:hypothetical protein
MIQAKAFRRNASLLAGIRHDQAHSRTFNRLNNTTTAQDDGRTTAGQAACTEGKRRRSLTRQLRSPMSAGEGACAVIRLCFSAKGTDNSGYVISQNNIGTPPWKLRSTFSTSFASRPSSMISR